METLFDHDERIALTKWHIQEKQLDKALAQIKPVLTEADDHDEAALIGARLYAQLQLFARAEALFKRYLKNHQYDINTQFQLGMCYFDQAENEQALLIWEKILQTNPLHPPALFYSAMVQLKNNKTGEATSALKKIMDSVPMDNLYYNKAKELLVQMDNPASAANNIPVGDIYKTEH